ncbi:hypothetical protein [Caldicellulosiruptor acetigenus]|nr:hypothetical protein [Caldicellulosiruptor acetigenus]
MGHLPFSHAGEEVLQNGKKYEKAKKVFFYFSHQRKKGWKVCY